MLVDITLLQTTAKQPADQKLFRAIRSDLYALESAINAAGAFDYQFKLNGYLSQLRNNAGTFATRYRFDGAMISKLAVFSQCRVALEQAGDSGTCEVDVRRYTTPNVPVTSLTHLFSAAISSIARRGSGISTQSIARSTPQIATQSVARWKTQHSVQSIVLLGAGLVQYNLNGTVDSDYDVGDSFLAASCTTGANNGNFVIVQVNRDGGNNLVVSNASGVAQAGTAGTVDLHAWKFTYTNPVNSEFTAGENVAMSGHTSGSNDGSFPIYAINQAGNNIILKGTGFVAQASAAGAADCNRWKFGLPASAASYGYFAVGEKVETSSHSSGGNDGKLRVTALDSGANNIVVYNAAGVAQGGAAGTINTLRWLYIFASDPSTSSNVIAGDNVWTSDATSAVNRGEFAVKEINVASSLNVVVYNADGIVQAGSGGTVYTSKIKLTFTADQSATQTTASRLTLVGSTSNTHTPGNIDGEYDVLEVNRGGGANYNAIVAKYLAIAINAPVGRITLESKSLFDTRPSFTVSDYAGKWANVSSNAVLNATQKSVPLDTLIMADILQIPAGEPKNLTIQLY